MLVLWIILACAFVALEASTAAVVCVWFIGGCIAALIAAAFGAGIPLQIVLFAIVSILLLIFARPVFKKYLKKEKTPTNADRVVGMKCIVTKEIDSMGGMGTVLADGRPWSARSEDGSAIPEGAHAEVMGIRGVCLIVKQTD